MGKSWRRSPFFYPGPAPLQSRESYITILADLYSIESEPYQIENSWVTYSEVKVTNGEEHDNAGFTLHKFNELTKTYQNFYDTFSNHDNNTTFGFTKYGVTNIATIKGWPYNGLLETNVTHTKPKSILQYKFNGALSLPTLVQREDYEYQTYIKDRLLSSTTQRVSNAYFLGTTFFERQYCLLKSKQTLTYDTKGENPTLTKVDYEYNDSTHNLLTKVITTDSKGDQIIKKTKYVPDYLNTTNTGPGSSISMLALKNDNIIVPIEEQLWKGNGSNGYTLVDGRLTVYDRISTSGASNNNLYQPIEFLNLEVGTIANNGFDYTDFIQDSNFSEVNWINGTANYDYKTNANLDYYSNGDLQKVTPRNDFATYYIWGYNQTQLIAKIEGYTSISTSQQTIINNAIAASNNDDDRCLNSQTCNEKTLRDKLTLLRNAFPNAFVTTYTYDLLIGLTSTTDPRGVITYYEYDNLNRLEQVKDVNEKVVSKNEYYYYKGQ